jgi:acetyl esterase
LPLWPEAVFYPTGSGNSLLEFRYWGKLFPFFFNYGVESGLSLPSLQPRNISMSRSCMVMVCTLLIFMQIFGSQNGAPDKKVMYKSTGRTELFLHLFYPPAQVPADRRPCIVFFFGGGWVSGSPEQFYPQCRYLAARGMLTVSAEYRIRSKHGATPFESVADAKSAVRWLRNHATELGLDPDRIAAGGGSSGGQLAAAAATLDSLDDLGEDLSVSSKPNALILFNPVIDNGPDGFGYNQVKERWKNFSPLHNIRPPMPPTIFFLGSMDKLVPVSTALEYKKQMNAVGARCDVLIYEGQPHSFFNFRNGTNPYYNATIVAADDFLKSLGYLTGAPSLEKPNIEAVKY